MNDLLILADDANGMMSWLFTGPFWMTVIGGYIIGKFDLIATAMAKAKGK